MSSSKSPHQIESLLQELGRALGFSFSSDTQTRLIHEPPADPDVFTDAVLREQGLDPASDIPSLRRVARRIVVRYLVEDDHVA
jgi:hypothetical protein